MHYACITCRNCIVVMCWCWLLVVVGEHTHSDRSKLWVQAVPHSLLWLLLLYHSYDNNKEDVFTAELIRRKVELRKELAQPKAFME